jgi:hypothetical protein
MTVAARAGLVVTIPLLMLSGHVTKQLSAPAPSRSVATAVIASTPTVESVQQVAVASDDTTQPNTDADPAVDFYGNEVTVAVAEYKIDGVGRLYELHSPQSELPRLGSPTS